MPNQVATANIIAGSSITATASVARGVQAAISTTAVVTTSPSANHHALAVLSVGATVSASISAQFSGTRAHIVAGASGFARGHAQRNASASLRGNSTFITWFIIDAAGTTIGHGTLSGTPVRQRHVSGVLAGVGSIGLKPEASVGIVAGSSITATATVNRGVQAALVVGSHAMATAEANRGATAAIVAGSILSPPATAQAAVFADSNLTPRPQAHRTVAASLTAGSSMSAAAQVHRGAHAVLSVGSSVAASVRANRGASSHILGSASVGAHPAGHFHAQAAIQGNSFVSPPDQAQVGAAIVAGSSVAATAELHHLLPYNPGLLQVVILGGQVTGAGTLGDRLLVSLAGNLEGAGTIGGTPVRRIGAIPLPMVGRGGMHDSIPLPMVGVGILSGYFEIIRVPRPLCPPRCPKEFRWGQILTRGDLELQVTDDSGNPFGPVVVLFAFYQEVRGGQRMLVGPPNRRPAVDNSKGRPGMYYATGTAGELGQPGLWIVQWRFQRSWWTPVQTFEERFKVVDVVESREPGSLYGRCRKYGWL